MINDTCRHFRFPLDFCLSQQNGKNIGIFSIKQHIMCLSLLTSDVKSSSKSISIETRKFLIIWDSLSEKNVSLFSIAQEAFAVVDGAFFLILFGKSPFLSIDYFEEDEQVVEDEELGLFDFDSSDLIGLKNDCMRFFEGGGGESLINFCLSASLDVFQDSFATFIKELGLS